MKMTVKFFSGLMFKCTRGRVKCIYVQKHNEMRRSGSHSNRSSGKVISDVPTNNSVDVRPKRKRETAGSNSAHVNLNLSCLVAINTTILSAEVVQVVFGYSLSLFCH